MASSLPLLKSSTTSVYVIPERLLGGKRRMAGTDSLKVLIDGPASDSKTAVPRTALPLQQCVLTPLVLEKLPRGSRTGTVKSAWEKAGIEAKWQESAWAKKVAQKERRRALTDFERFKVLRLRKAARFEVRKSLAKVKAASK